MKEVVAKEIERLTRKRIKFLQESRSINGVDTSYSKDHVLNYPEVCHFYAKDIADSGLKNIGAHLNRYLKEYQIVRLHKGSGGIAHYRLSDERMKALIDELYNIKL